LLLNSKKHALASSQGIAQHDSKLLAQYKKNEQQREEKEKQQF